MRPKLRQFAPSSAQKLLGQFIIVVGPFGSGKTALVRDLAVHLAPKIVAAVAVGLDGVAPPSSIYASLDAGSSTKSPGYGKSGNRSYSCSSTLLAIAESSLRTAFGNSSPTTAI